MKPTTTVKAIFEKEGYVYNKDGRTRSHRALQALLDSGLINFKVCQSGMAWNKDGIKYNVMVTIKKPDGTFSAWRVYSQITNKDAYDILKIIGQILQKPQVKDFMSSYVDIDCSCQKCEGRGIVPAFHYYCNGVCFDCYGLGYNRKFKPTVELNPIF